MIESDEANELAEAKKQELSGPLDLRRATSLPLKLPDGWRFPYDAYVDTLRLRQTLLILFVDKEGQVEEEWNDLERSKAQLEEGLPQERDLAKLDDVLSIVRRDYPKAQIESVEAVLDITDESGTYSYWRVGIMDGIHRHAILVSPDLSYSDPQPRSRGAIKRWDLGRIRYRRRSGNLTAKLKNLPENQDYLRSQWTVWSCMAHATEFIECLNYGEIGSHNVRIEHISTSDKKAGAAFSSPRGIPTISFARGGGWADDPTIVLHELCHAFWSLLFTRPPRAIDTGKYNVELDGVQEGFADYFSAILYARNGDSVEIGGNLPTQIANLFRQLPRTIDGRPVNIPSSADAADVSENEFSYLVGRKWANLLWDYRQQFTTDEDKTKADAAIISAHVKPRTNNSTSLNPLAVYFHSLINTATRLDIPFDDWSTLANNHQLSLE